MEWIPSWLAKSYAGLYAEKSKDWFDFEEAKKILNIEDKRVLSRRLTRLEEAGFLIAKRDAVDKRKKYFRTLNPNDVIFSYGIVSSVLTKDIMERLMIIAKKITFVIGGAYAAYIHSGYAIPGKIDVYVKEEDLDRWISLLSDRSASVSVDDMLSEKTKRTNFHIHSTLNEEMVDNSAKVDGISYESPEILILDGIRDQTEFSLMDSFAILIKKRKEIDFGRLLKLAKSESLDRELGACLEIINLESKKKIFSDEMIHKIHLKTDLSKKKTFTRYGTEENYDYLKIGKKWNLKLTLSRAFVSKIVIDLVR
ncbi:MAG: hypothetical protein ACRD92_06435 [Nitrosopumilaceae archaeon]